MLKTKINFQVKRLFREDRGPYQGHGVAITVKDHVADTLIVYYNSPHQTLSTNLFFLLRTQPRVQSRHFRGFQREKRQTSRYHQQTLPKYECN